MSDSPDVFNYTKKELPSNFIKFGYAAFVVGLVLVILSLFVDNVRSAFSGIMLLMFVASIGVGSLFWIVAEYLSGAVWSTPFRRVAEFLGALLLVLPIVALPAYLNMHDIFHWTHEEVVKADHYLSAKAPYLNVSFFTIRTVVFIAIWVLFYLLITKNSKLQDTTKDQNLTRKNIKLSAIFVPLFALSITFFSIDWLMSLEPHWYSTIFGVYYFSGTVLAALAAITYIVVTLSEKGYFFQGVKEDHYYSFGALLFGFVNFWAYIAFSQFLLIWYANLPEETIWYLERWEGYWMYFSIALIFIHFIVPYFGLLAQPSKMNPKRLKFMSLWILFAHFFDILWMTMPTYQEFGYFPGWIELGYAIFAIGLILVVFNWKAGKENLVPIGDPKLKRGINFRL